MGTWRSKQAYREYLQSSHWKEVQRRMYSQYRYCQVCKVAGQLDIHHITYARIGHELDTDLIVLLLVQQKYMQNKQKTRQIISLNKSLISIILNK